MPRVANEFAPGVTTQATHFRLWSVLLLAVTTIFVTALIFVTGNLSTYWPLYLVPIVIAAFAYHVGGAVTASVLASVLIALLMLEAEASLAAVPQLSIGMGVFLLSGVVIGTQARRQRQHARLLERASIRDQLTGLYKSGHLHDRLNEEISRCDRQATPVAFMLVAVNDYAGFKDRFGHYKADLMLQHLADLIQISIRDIDIVARYRSTEFAVVLPFTSTEQADIVAEHISRTVADAEFEGDVIDAVGKVTVSLGTAAYPEDAPDENELIRLATERLGVRKRMPAKAVSDGFNSMQQVLP
ncbi:MAG: diguanylate cyclase [Coriobacteriia bacterium]|nr:diguanylate cyclase [Coriobacteriia bacterium]